MDMAKRRAYNREYMRRLRERQLNGYWTPEQVLAFNRHLGRQDPDTGCIEWNGAYNHRHFGAESNRPVFQSTTAHKAAWLIAQLLFEGHPVAWPKDEDGIPLQAAHICRNPDCVNYQHIHPMTAEEHRAYDGDAPEPPELTPEEIERLELPDPF